MRRGEEKAGSAHRRSAWRSEQRGVDGTRKSINTVVLVGDRDSCLLHRGLVTDRGQVMGVCVYV